MKIVLRNIILAVFLCCLLNTGCRNSFRISNKKVEPISIYTLSSSKFQAKDLLDSIVYHDTSLSYRSLTEYIDTFILERSFSLIHKINSDSIEYFYSFSGDVKEWLTYDDSTFIGLFYLSINGSTYDAEKFNHKPQKTKDKYLKFFENNIIGKLSKQIAVRPKYSVHIIDSTKRDRIVGEGVVCNTLGKCDTMFIKYIDGGRYTGIKK